MSDHFFLRLEPHELDSEEPQATWYHAGQTGQGRLAEAAEAAHGFHITVIVPGQLCTATQVSLPGVSRSRLAKATPFALEEQLVDDVDELHFSLGEATDGTVPVVVIKRVVLEQWLALLERYNMTPHKIIPDYFAIPCPPQGWHLWFDEPGVMLRYGRAAGLRMMLTTPLFILQRLYDEVGQKPEQLLVSGDYEALQDELLEWCQQNEIELIQGESSPQLLQTAAANVPNGEVINLLQGDYSHQEKMSRQWRPWWPAVAVLAMMALFQLISMTADHQRLTTLQAALDQEIKQLYLDTFPDAKRVVDPRAQMEARLKEQSVGMQGDQFYPLLGGVTLLSDNKVKFELQRLRYHNGELNVDMHLQNLQVLDQIKQLFSDKPGLHAEVVSASARGNKVEARLLIKGSRS
ncbi:MAG: type II secretion system protein GspL [Gammaproteobacteria bacterium]|nr:type II secretion system protein GspL [Gammaproteobacteria bacterium]MCF6229642.1 type II secretion system protein GspL [Gammaproteobacteria bacterium]